MPPPPPPPRDRRTFDFAKSSVVLSLTVVILVVKCVHSVPAQQRTETETDDEVAVSSLQLTDTVFRLQAQVSQLQEQRSQDAAALQKLVQKKDSSSESPVIAVDSVRRLESQLDNLKSELTSLVAAREREVDRLSDVRELRLELDSTHSECQKLRSEVQALKERREEDLRLVGQQRNSQVTVKWLQKSVDEIRGEMKELAAAQNVSAAIRQQQQFETAVALLRSDVVALRGQLEESRVARDTDAALVAQLRIDADDLRGQNHQMGANAQLFREELSQFKDELLVAQQQQQQQQTSSKRNVKSLVLEDDSGGHSGGKSRTDKATGGASSEKSRNYLKKSRMILEGDKTDVITTDLSSLFNPATHHRLRHHGKVREELEEVKSLVRLVYKRQTALDNQFRQMRHNQSVVASDVRHVWGRLGDLLNTTRAKVARQASKDRVMTDLRRDLSALERSVAQSGKILNNLSEATTGIDKLHSSTVQLFEALEGIEDEYGQRIGDLHKEVSKFEFSMAQLGTSVSILKEDEANHYDALKATRVDVSALRQETDNAKLKLTSLRSEILGEEARKIIRLVDDKPTNRKSSKDEDSPGEKKNLDMVVLQLESDVGRLQARLLTQSLLINDTVDKLSHKADLRHVTQWAASADLLDDKIETVSKKLQVLESRIIRDEEGLNSVYHQFPADCSAMTSRPSDVYEIYPRGSTSPLNVFCDMNTDSDDDDDDVVDEGGWTVIQRHVDNDIDFDRDWIDYKLGFGNAAQGNFWLGNDHLHRLTAASDGHGGVELRIDLWNKEDGRYHYARYGNVSVDDEAHLYRLHVGRRLAGNVSDALSYHDGMAFSTRDADHDSSAGLQCAQLWMAGWWYKHCQKVNVNGRYSVGLTWYDDENNTRLELSRVEMKIRPQIRIRR